jgi:hydroxyacyl-ACP dehydratase HTD2-like protein with hotdog domain
MASISRRLFTTSAHAHSNSASEACSELLSRFSNAPVSTRSQLLDANQLHLLSVTLNRTPTSYNLPKDGTPIPPGYHLVYFTPSIIESELGLDGTDRTVNPLSPFTRRMWAGGELTWTQDPSALLRIGQEVHETTELISAEPKKLKSGGEMLVVGVSKTFSNDTGIALVDKRSWVFQREITPDNPIKAPAKPELKALPEGQCQRDFCQSDTTLFRFSALTFNGHKIHYSPEWCREVEGHRNAVVHGPLNLINMLDFWRDTAKGGSEEAVPKSIAYRAMSPLYAGEPYRILLEKGGEQEKGWKAEIWDSFGKQSMKGTIAE